MDSESPQAVMNSQKKILNALANVFRNEAQYQALLNERKQEAVAAMSADLGVGLTPEIIDQALKIRP
ncbi:hypothetical protein MRY82_00110 [bacterium]|nr:hypothetical protein [bacterium]